MKKALKIIIAVFAVIIVAVGAVAVWQYQNIISIVQGVRQNADEIKAEQIANSERLVSEINEYMDDSLREPTDEEKELIEKGETTFIEVYAKIISEKTNQDIVYNSESKEFEGTTKKEENENNKGPINKEEVNNSSSKDAIVSKYVARLYALESSFEARSEALISEAYAYFLAEIEKTDPNVVRSKVIATYTPRVSAIQSECDGAVNSIIKDLTGELKKIGADTGIIKTIQDTYQKEKQLKLSYYANKYLK